MNIHSNTQRFFRLAAAVLIVALGILAVGTMRSTVMPEPAGLGSGGSGTQDAVSSLSVSPTALPDRTSASSERHAGVYHARVGSRFVFDLDYVTELALSVEHDGVDHPTGDQRLQAHGDLELTVAARRANEILVAIRLLDLTLESTATVAASPAAAAAAAEVVAACRVPVLVKMAEDGQLLGYAFAERHNGEARSMLGGLLGLLAFVVPIDAAGQWEAEATDLSGTFHARYHRLPTNSDGDMALRRIKTHYLTMVGFDDGVGEHQVSGQSSAWIDTGLGWLRRAEVDERLAMELPFDMGRLNSHVKLALALTESDWVANVCKGDPWSRPFAPVTGSPGAEHRKTMETAQWQQRLQGVTLQNLLAELEALLASGAEASQEAFNTWTKLAWLLTLDADAAAELRDLILANGMNSKIAMLGLSALGKAGTPVAQASLVAILDSISLPAEVRSNAATGMYSLESPRGEVFEALANHVGDMTALDEVRGSSLLAFGVLAGRSGDPMGNGQTPLDNLLSMEGQAGRAGATADWLDAVGNSRDAQAFDRVAAHLNHGDAGVRQSAVEALRSHDSARAASAIEHRAIHDRDINVRVRAVQVLGMRRDQHAATTLARLATQEASPIIRRAAITEIAGLGHSSTPGLLAHMAQNDPDKGVRELAQQLLGSKT